MAAWIQKSPGCELSVFLSSSSPPTTHHFLGIPHFLTAIKHCISFLHITKFLPAPFYLFFTSFIITFQLFIFSFFIHVSPIHLRNKVWNLQVVYKGRCYIRLQTTDAFREITEKALHNEKLHTNVLKYICENCRWLLFLEL
jgi:hypothetical protein